MSKGYRVRTAKVGRGVLNFVFLGGVRSDLVFVDKEARRAEAGEE